MFSWRMVNLRGLEDVGYSEGMSLVKSSVFLSSWSSLSWFRCKLVYFLSSLRGQTAKTLICTKSGASADSRKSAEKCRKARRTALFAQKVYKKCAKSAVLRTFWHFSALFLESAETPLFVQINVFAVWPLRLDRKYTSVNFPGPFLPRVC